MKKMNFVKKNNFYNMNYKEVSKIKSKEILKGFDAKLIHTDNFTLSFVTIKVNAELPEHAHIHEQITQITEGELELTIDGVTKIFIPGMIAIIPSNIKHSGKALTTCKVTDIFYPVREDYK